MKARLVTCNALSPGGNLTCVREDCNGVGHVWEHTSAYDAEANDEDH